ncbi:MAG: helix-turn-helix domain-containing protein [Desulfuromusa sp.]|nr:helix-turn-helix domain-containing protein [Desulfuromusa sp.]
MLVFLEYLHVIGAFQGLVLACLLIFGAHNSNANKILGGWCLFLALSFLGPFITMSREVNLFSGFIGWSYFLPASYGAFLYLYCRHAITDHPLTYRDLLHTIPLLLCFLLNIELLLASPEVKLNTILDGRPESIGILLSELIQYLQAFIYIGFTVVLIRKYRVAAKNNLANFNPDIFSWLWKLLILDFVIWSLFSLNGLLKATGSISGNNLYFSTLGDGLIIILIYSIAMAQWRNPRLFKIEQLTIDTTEDPENLEADSGTANGETSSSPATTSSGALDDNIRSGLLKVVRQHMQEQQTYLDNRLTLTSLSAAIGVSTHHLSEVLNQQEGKNFYQFVNEYRINYICERLKEDKSIKILELAMAAGFSSKSTFNAVFKQFTNFTPSQYRNNLTAV